MGLVHILRVVCLSCSTYNRRARDRKERLNSGGGGDLKGTRREHIKLSGCRDWKGEILRVERRGVQREGIGERSNQCQSTRKNTENLPFCKLIRWYNILKRIGIEISSIGVHCASLKSPQGIKSSSTRWRLPYFKLLAREVNKQYNLWSLLLVVHQDLMV